MNDEERNRLLNMINELADVASWYQSLHNDVAATTPEYFGLCADPNAVQYLRSEAEAIHDRARALLSEYAARERAALARLEAQSNA